eukprot:26940_1
MTTSLSSLESVNNAITECMDKDEQPWDYYEQLQSSQNGKYHYNSNRLIKLNEIGIPKAISDSINQHKNHYFGGFFESINRAYFAIDSCIYLWDYSNNGGRWCCLNQFNECITALSLVQSKRNIFIDKIEYLLIVATKIEIIVIGIGFTANGEIEAFPTKYKISTDGVEIKKIICDAEDTKRIFLCCDHGSVYEFEYFYKQNMFGQHIRKCVKTNISDSFTSKLFKSFVLDTTESGHETPIIDLMIHNDIFYSKCLFSLSAKGEINGYAFVGNEQTATTKILRYNKLWNELQLQIQQMTPDNRDGLRSLNDFAMIKIFAINKYESRQCQLMGITSNGDRLFFTISQSATNTWHMELSFIRIRPPFLNYNSNNNNSGGNSSSLLLEFEPSIQPSSSPRNVLSCFHDEYDGVTLMNSLRNSHSSDALLLISRNNVETIKSKYVHRNKLIESIESDLALGQANTNNLILALCAMPKRKSAAAENPAETMLLYSRKEMKKLNAAKPFIGLSPFAIQHLVPCSVYLVLRQKSIVFYKLLRYLDEFETLLCRQNYDAILKFIDKIGLIECEVMCLLIMMSNIVEEDGGGGNEEQRMMVREAHKLFMTPLSHQTDVLYHDIMQRLACSSTKILSILLCLSRILRPIWCSPICILDISNNHHICARYSVEQLYRIMKPLISFKLVLAEVVNQQEVASILEWLDKCIQILSVLIMFTRCHFNNIYDELPNESQNLLKHICFEQLISKQCGYELLTQIIARMVHKLNDNDIKRLHHECPTYFSSAQLVTFLAKSQLTDKIKSKSTLETSLTMFCDVCDDAAFDVHQVCDLLRQADYYHGVCKLVFTLQNKLIVRINQLANKQIHESAALNNNNNNSNLMQMLSHSQHIQQMQHKEQQIRQLRARIQGAWKEILECLQILYIAKSSSEKQLISHCQERVLRLCLMEKNRDFAYRLYEWFLDHKLIHVLFSYNPRYLEEFLSSKTVLETEDEKSEKARNKRLIKLVYFYKANGEMKKLIQLLDALTKSNGFELEERNNFLIEAKRATKILQQQKKDSFDPHNPQNDKYNKFEEKSILCQIQLNLLNELRSIPHEDADEDTLNYRLLNLEKIYSIASRYKLYEYALDCLSFSNDPGAVQHINRCWFSWIANVIKSNGPNEWTQYAQNNLHRIVNKYNLSQQPFMFDVILVVVYLNNVNFQTHALPSNTVIVDMIYPKIQHISYEKMVEVYKSVLNQVDPQYKQNICESIYYLLSQKQQPPQRPPPAQQQQFNHNNPRLFNHNTSLNLSNSQHNLSFISSTNNIQDLISNCLNCLERISGSDAALTQQFQQLREQYSL